MRGRQQLEAAGQPTTEIDAQQAALDAQRAVLDEQQTQLTDGLATIDEEEAALVRGAALLALADEIRVVSEDGATAIVNVQFTEPRLELAASSKEAVIEHFESEPIDGVEVAFSTDISQGVPEILGVGEVVGVALAAVVLIVMLGSLLAASFPIITAIVGVAIGAMGTLAFSGVVQMASVTPILGVMLGLAVGIDYSLFILYRHRKQLLQGADVVESIGLANGTAGNAVVFAGTTVIVALLALNITGIPFLGLMGTAGAVSVGIAVLIAISLTPALLGLAKTRVLGRRARSRAAAAAELGSDTPRTRQRGVKPMSNVRAVLTMLVAIVALLIMAIPALSMRLGLPDGGSEADDSSAYRRSRSRRSPSARARTVRCWSRRRFRTTSTTARCSTTSWRSPKRSRPWTTSSRSRRSPCRTTTASRPSRWCPPKGPNSVSTETLVRDLRELPPIAEGVTLGVAGQAAINIDISEGLADVLPLYLLVVVGLSFLIMVMVFRSLLVPLIATGGFVLSLFATYGAGHRDLPVGLVRRPARHPQPRSDPELPAGDPGRHPVRPRDGLPAVPDHRACARRGRTVPPRGWPSRRASAPDARS